MDLSIRGAAYENRLVKYAARGFAIAVAELEKPRIEKRNIEVKTSLEGGWGGQSFCGDGFSWDKWESSNGTLLHILVSTPPLRARVLVPMHTP